MTPSGIETATFRFVTQCLDHLCDRGPQLIMQLIGFNNFYYIALTGSVICKIISWKRYGRKWQLSGLKRRIGICLEGRRNFKIKSLLHSINKINYEDLLCSTYNPVTLVDTNLATPKRKAHQPTPHYAFSFLKTVDCIPG